MNLLFVLIVLMVLLGFSGFYVGGPMMGTLGSALIVFVLLVLFYNGGLSRK